MPIPCCPLVWLMVWKREPNNSRPNALSIDAYGMPGPLSWAVRMSSSFLPCTRRISMLITGGILASSQASSELSTASLTAVMIERVRLSKPRKCLFFSKNSLMDACCILGPGSLAAIGSTPARRSSLGRMTRGPRAADCHGKVAVYHHLRLATLADRWRICCESPSYRLNVVEVNGTRWFGETVQATRMQHTNH